MRIKLQKKCIQSRRRSLAYKNAACDTVNSYQKAILATHKLNKKTIELYPVLDKVILYNLAFSSANILSNPAIQLLISGNKQINEKMKVKDHKKYADAILKCNKNWQDNLLFFKYTYELQDEIKHDCVSQLTIKKIEDLIEEYYFLPDEDKGLDDQLKPTLKQTEFDYEIKDPKYKLAAEYIHQKWAELIRKTPKCTSSTLIPLPNPYVIPGGRFREIYYWDSYFTILGLICSGYTDLAKGMVENFFYLIEQFGFIPNGNRTYYLSRSQPPFLALMVEQILESTKADPEWIERAYNAVSFEYKNTWMNPNTHYISEIGLNRYYDPVDKKRPECFGDDNKDAKPEIGHFMQERSECESGMDFTRRFDGRCSDFASLDLNCLLYKYEILLEKWALILKKNEDAKNWQEKSQLRKELLYKYLYNPYDELFYDYDTKNKRLSTFKSIAMSYPLWVGIVDKEKSAKLANTIVREFELDGGVCATTKNLDFEKYLNKRNPVEYQWDFPNGWAPLQLIAIESLINSGYINKALDLSIKWLDTNTDIFLKTHTFFEKYNISKCNENVTTSYPQQEGFGWTNGVYLQILTKILPQLKPPN